MLTGFKNKVPEENGTKGNGAPPKAADVVSIPMHASRPGLESAAAKLEATARAAVMSCIGSGMTIIGKIECSGPAQVFGRLEGELRASDLTIGEGAQVEGSIVAQDVTICGRVKGTVRAVHVRLQGGGSVEGDIFHRSLSIDESSFFEGSSRRVENPTESSVDTKASAKKLPQASSSPALTAIDADLHRH
jgi:cytoskeletal protein CcmA (bactofilin family)